MLGDSSGCGIVESLSLLRPALDYDYFHFKKLAAQKKPQPKHNSLCSWAKYLKCAASWCSIANQNTLTPTKGHSRDLCTLCTVVPVYPELF